MLNEEHPDSIPCAADSADLPPAPLEQARQFVSRELPQALERTAEVRAVLDGWQVRPVLHVAALLLPVIQAQQYPDSDLRAEFGPRALQIATLTHKLLPTDSVPSARTPREHYADQLRRLYTAAYADVETVLLCIADRLADMDHLDALDESQRVAWARCNLNVYLPLLELLGLWSQRRALGDISLKRLDPARSQRLHKRIAFFRRRYQHIASQLRQEMTDLLEAGGLEHASIDIHRLSLTDVYRRDERHQHRRRAGKARYIWPLRLDVVLETPAECYQALGLLHHGWPQAPDYPLYDSIAAPKANGYRALVTTVVYPTRRADHGQLVELRIYTRSMQRINNYGLVEAMCSGERVRGVWWLDLDARQRVRRSSNTDSLTVFTADGALLHDLRPGSTALDAAFRLDASQAPYARQFVINGRPLPPSRTLNHGDLIEIDYDLRYPSLTPEWENATRQPATRAQVRRFLNQRNRTPAYGKSQIHNALERLSDVYQLRFTERELEERLTPHLKSYRCTALNDLYLKVAEANLDAETIALDIIEGELLHQVRSADGSDLPNRHYRFARCWLNGHPEPAAARPILPGVAIVAQETPQSSPPVIVIHRRDCPHLDPARPVIPLAWRTEHNQREAVEVVATGPSHPNHVAVMVQNVFQSCNIGEEGEFLLHNMQAEAQAGYTSLRFTAYAPTAQHLEQLHAALHALREHGHLTDFKLWQVRPGSKRLLADKADRRRQNLFTLRQIKDHGMFFGRDQEIGQLIDYFSEGQTFAVLYGQKRIGKTSLLYQLAEHLLPRAYDVVPVLFDAQRITPFNAQTFLSSLAQATSEKLMRGPQPVSHRRLRPQDLQHDPFDAFAGWVQHIHQRLSPRRLLFVVDEFTRAEEEYKAGKVASDFFDGMQWLVGSTSIPFLLCVHDHVFRDSSRTWPILQRGHPVRLGSLDHASAGRLIRQPLEPLYQIDYDLIETILDLTNCHPYLIHALGQALTSHMLHRDGDHITEHDLQAAINEVFQNGDHYFSHYLSRTNRSSKLTLQTIAHIAGVENQWVEKADIYQALDRHDKRQRLLISESIGDLYRAHIIEARQLGGPPRYRIPVRLFQLWLRQRTHPLVAQDMQVGDLQS